MSSTIISSSPRSFDLMEVLDLLISDLFLNFSEHSNCRVKGLNDSAFYLIKAKPSVSLKDYLSRLRKLTKCSTEVILLAFVYFDRVIQKTQFNLRKLNVHKLMCVALFSALKFHEDTVNPGSFYAKVSGIKQEELKMLEIEFLEMIEYRLYVNEFDYRNLKNNLTTLFNIRLESLN